MPVLNLTLFTNDPALALKADQAGVQRIGPDLEIVGKHERQGHLNTRISAHTIDDFIKIAKVVRKAQLFARVNPIHSDSRSEIETLVELGAQVLMLPMVSSVDEVHEFLSIVGGRARTVLLLETSTAALRLDQFVRIPGVDEFHFGLNDLQISFGASSQLEVLKSDLMDSLCGTVRRAGIPYGIGGVARVDATDLPFPPHLFYQEYVRLGSQGAILSRSFFSGNDNLALEIEKLRCALRDLHENLRAETFDAQDRL